MGDVGFSPQDGEQTPVWGGGEGDHRAHPLRLLPTIILPVSTFASPLPILPSPPPPHSSFSCRHHRSPRCIGSSAQSGCQKTPEERTGQPFVSWSRYEETEFQVKMTKKNV